MAQSTLQLCHQLARIPVSKGVHIHIHRCLQLGVWSTETDIRQLQLHRIHYESAIELVYLQAAFLLKPGFTNLDIYLRIAIIERVCLQSQGRQGEMVEVHARYRTDIVLVIVHLAVLPVKMAYLIKSFVKVEIGSLRHRISKVSIHLECISRHV